jgi:predicted acetyltransferase
MAGLTMVTVRPTHRRRGLLRGMINAHLADAAAHGEPVSGLWASDAVIYGRFGYGVAVEADELEVAGDDGFDRAPAGGFDAVVSLDAAAAAAQLPAVYARAAAGRPGMISRPPAWWTWRRFTDRADVRKGRSPRRHVACRRGGELTGYVVYRQKLDWDDAGHPAGKLDIEELIAVDATAEATLWQHVTHVDLFPRISWWNAPTDSLVPWLVDDRRNVVRGRNPDTLWLRLGDVAGALAARRYLADGSLRLGVRAPGSEEVAGWELTVEGGTGRCRASATAPELELDLATLGSIYLGGFAPSLLARAGAIRGSAEALARADRMFRWPTAPWSAEIF